MSKNNFAEQNRDLRDNYGVAQPFSDEDAMREYGLSPEVDRGAERADVAVNLSERHRHEIQHTARAWSFTSKNSLASLIGKV